MDCDAPLDKIINRCLALGINCVNIADHGTIEGALKMQQLAPFSVIVSEEILTPHGEIMGMFLRKTISSGQSVEKVLSQIREQGGLVCIPHPFDTVRGSALNSKIIEEIVGQIDVMEVFNARNTLLRSSNRARTFAEKHGIAKSAGSDAHSPHEIGNAYVEMPEFAGRDDFLQALTNGNISGHRTNPLTHFHSVVARLKKRFIA